MAEQDGRHGFGQDEWEILLYLPVVVFLVVAWADGRVQPAETNRFAFFAKNTGVKATRPQDALVQDVLGQVSREFSQVAGRLDARCRSGVSMDEILATGRTLLDTKAEPTEARVFKNTMMVLAVAVAEAAPLFGKKICPEEQNAINLIRDLLGLTGPADTFVPFG